MQIFLWINFIALQLATLDPMLCATTTLDHGITENNYVESRNMHINGMTNENSPKIMPSNIFSSHHYP